MLYYCADSNRRSCFDWQQFLIEPAVAQNTWLPISGAIIYQSQVILSFFKKKILSRNTCI